MAGNRSDAAGTGNMGDADGPDRTPDGTLRHAGPAIKVPAIIGELEEHGAASRMEARAADRNAKVLDDATRQGTM